jgi:uncharacterized protein with FMN-binding domain
MKKVLVIISIIILSIIVIGGIAYNRINKNLQTLEDIKVNTIDLNSLEDGTYQGSYTVFPVKVEVEVEIRNHTIEDIKIIEHDNGKGKAAEEIIETIKERQTIDVDIIAGATYSSRVIQKAIEAALLKK